jgi:hypothetical protein
LKTPTFLYGLGTTLLFLLTGQSPSELPEKKLKIDFRNSVKISSELTDWIDKLIELLTNLQSTTHSSN